MSRPTTAGLEALDGAYSNGFLLGRREGERFGETKSSLESDFALTGHALFAGGILEAKCVCLDSV